MLPAIALRRSAAVMAAALLGWGCSGASTATTTASTSMFGTAPATTAQRAVAAATATIPRGIAEATDAGSPEGGALAAALGWVEIAPEHRAGYDRSAWHHWNAGALDDGLSTRHEVLADQSLCAVRVAAGTVREGCWRSLYDAATTTAAADVEIDHVVALVEAHDSGGWAWDARRREAFANWHGGLLAVTAASNGAKSGADPAHWLPPDAAMVCPFLLTWTMVKIEWGLSMDAAEHAAIARHVDGCTDDVTLFDVLAASGAD